MAPGWLGRQSTQGLGSASPSGKSSCPLPASSSAALRLRALGSSCCLVGSLRALGSWDWICSVESRDDGCDKVIPECRALGPPVPSASQCGPCLLRTEERHVREKPQRFPAEQGQLSAVERSQLGRCLSPVCLALRSPKSRLPTPAPASLCHPVWPGLVQLADCPEESGAELTDRGG